MAIPVLGRLTFRDHLSLIIGFALVLLEIFLRAATSFLPKSLLAVFYNLSTQFVARPAERTRMHQLQEADSFDEMCAAFGYEAQEHVVQTQDGYILCLHRLCHTKAELAERDGQRGSGKRPKPVAKPVVYLHHGLMMNSEVWVCNLEEERQLPFVLVERGYDVWLGNNRGNKYSKKHITLKSNDKRFWDFSLDDFALRDIPDAIDYILYFTKQQQLSYIGFSQGTAQAFATLSIHPALNERVNVFIALAPAMSPRGLHNLFVDALMKASPTALFLFFGRKAILPSTVFWQSIMYPPLFVRLLDASMGFLFGWHGQNMSFQQKSASYYHLYSYASVKSLVHWFQILRSGQFQMYDDDLAVASQARPGRPSHAITKGPHASGAASRRALTRAGSFYKAAKFPTRNIAAPVVLLYGGRDSLVDIDAMLASLPAHTITHCVPHFEHLDFLWAREVDTLVIPQVLTYLERFEAQHLQDHPHATQRVVSSESAAKREAQAYRIEPQEVTLQHERNPQDGSPASTHSSNTEGAPLQNNPGLGLAQRRSSLASVHRGGSQAGTRSPTPSLFSLGGTVAQKRLSHRRGSAAGTGRGSGSAGSIVAMEGALEDLKAAPTTQLSGGGALDWSTLMDGKSVA